jgi:hypothetical protein
MAASETARPMANELDLHAARSKGFSMKALRKLMLGVVAAMGLLLPLTGGSEAKAGGGYAVQVCHYHVYYRSCPHDSWHYLGCYPCAYSAQAAGAALSARGYYWWCQPICY